MISALAEADAFLFDCDGLLVGTEQLFTIAEAKIFADSGLEFTPEHKAKLIGHPVPEVGLRIGRMVNRLDDAERIADEVMEIVADLVCQPLVPLPGVVDLVDLVGARRPTAVVSNSPRSLVDMTLRSSGLADRFTTVVCLEDAARPKPAPDLYLLAAKRLGVEPSRCVAFEDSATGVAAARAAGIPVIGVPHERDQTIGANWHVDSLEDRRLARAVAALAAG